MSYDALLIHEVTIVNKSEGTETTIYGDPIDTESTVTSVARVEQTTGLQGVEDLAGQDRLTTVFTVFLPADTEVDGASIIEWEGKRLQVFGDPAEVYDSTGAHHMELRAEEITGG